MKIKKAIKSFCQRVCGGKNDSCESFSFIKTFIEELNK